MADEKALWYVVHTYSGYENKVANDLVKTVENNGMGDLIQEVTVPIEEVVEIRNGKPHTIQHKLFPGYVLVKMIKTTESWYVVRNTRGVTGFVGPGSEPIPLTDEDYERMTSCQGTIRIDLEPGDNVRIKSGSVENAIGTVEEINAEEAGADYVGAEELVAKIQGENWFDFDVVVATPNMMGVVGRLGRVLGPKGLMPNPKSGTVTMDVAKAISEIKAGKVEYRLDKQAIIHCPIGKKSFTAEQLTANLTTLMNAINRAKPAAAKGIYLRSVVLSSTMGPGIKVNPLKF